MRVVQQPFSQMAAVFLHGGPGAGTSPGNRRFFDPEFYRGVHAEALPMIV